MDDNQAETCVPKFIVQLSKTMVQVEPLSVYIHEQHLHLIAP